MKRKIAFLLVISFFFQIIQEGPLLASDQDIPYAIRIPYRLARGITNIGLGWTEIFLRPFGEHRTESVGESLAMGAINGMTRLGVGLVDISTFWVPDIQMTEMYPDWQGWPYLFHWS